MVLVEQLERESGDDHQDQHRQAGPEHLDVGVVAPLGRGRIGPAVEADDADQQESQHEQRDDRDDRHQDPVVEEDRLVLEDRGRRLEIDRARRRLAHQVRRARLKPEAGRGDRCDESRRPALEPPHPNAPDFHALSIRLSPAAAHLTFRRPAFAGCIRGLPPIAKTLGRLRFHESRLALMLGV